MSISDIQISTADNKRQEQSRPVLVPGQYSRRKKKTQPSAYSEKLKHPLWQKLRLEVFERDNWTCQECFSKENSLQVHHCYYAKGNPWNTPADCLVTLCAVCHEERQKDEEKAKHALGRMLANLRPDYRLALVNSLIIAARERIAPVVVDSVGIHRIATALHQCEMNAAYKEQHEMHNDLNFWK